MTDPLREILFLADYGFKQFGGHSYDVQFANGGEEIFVFDLAGLLELVTGGELMLN